MALVSLRKSTVDGNWGGFHLKCHRAPTVQTACVYSTWLQVDLLQQEGLVPLWLVTTSPYYTLRSSVCVTERGLTIITYQLIRLKKRVYLKVTRCIKCHHELLNRSVSFMILQPVIKVGLVNQLL